MAVEEFLIAEEESGCTLHRFLQSRFSPRFSGKELKRWVEEQRCQLNGRIERFGSTKLHAGDKLKVSISAALTGTPKKVLFENSSYIAVDKWPGLVCENSIIRQYYPETVLIHRLDKDTSGVLLLAKSEAVRKKFVEAFRGKRVKKTYLAICQGIPEKKSGTVRNYLVPEGQMQGQTLWSVSESPPGELAETSWALQDQKKESSLICCHPITGRTHQLRVHMRSLGIPIFGDPLYNKKSYPLFAPRLMLHASKIVVPAEIDGVEREFESPLPEDFSGFWKALPGT